MQRRTLLKLVTAAATGVPFMGRAASDILSLTASDAEGPYYPVEKIPITDSLILSDNVLGESLLFYGRVLNRDAMPLAGARMEIWQCDANQVYRHPADMGEKQPDPAFKGFAAAITNDKGEFSFHTIVPVAYVPRPPHIHVKVFDGDRHLLTTQVYVEGEQGPDSRKIAPQAGADGYRASFDFVVVS